MTFNVLARSTIFRSEMLAEAKRGKKCGGVCACHTGVASFASRFLSAIARPPGCSNTLMKYLPFYYYVPRAHRRFSPLSPLSPSPNILPAAIAFSSPAHLAGGARRWIAPRGRAREAIWIFALPWMLYGLLHFCIPIVRSLTEVKNWIFGSSIPRRDIRVESRGWSQFSPSYGLN